jgi:hypothetical protein
MMTPRQSGNRGIGNPLALPAALVKPLIPFARIPKSAQKDSLHSHLPCVIFLKVGRWWNHPSKTREKATQ